MNCFKTLRAFFVSLPLFLLSARAAVVDATWNTASDVPVTATSYTATGNTVNFTLNHAPATGTNLMVVKNTGLPFIQGIFGNLTQGQAVALVYAGITYDFVANYYGGTGNDLVLQWAKNRPVAWGDNGSGQLGDGSTTQRRIPTPITTTGVLSGKTLVSMTAGSSHSLALCSDGTIAAWGANSAGQFGNNSTTASSVPVAVIRTGVLLGKTVVAVSPGSSHSLALCSDGTVASWGSNFYGELGNNDTAASLVPVLVNTSGALAGKSVVAIAAGGDFSLALCSDGTVVGWGYNDSGRLGNGTTANSLVPVAVSTSGVLSGKIVTKITSGADYSLALDSSGKMYAWGYGYSGELGNGIGSSSSVPVAVSTTGVLSGKVVTAASAGGSHSLAVCSDGTLATWGSNGSGQLGNNGTTSSSSPVTVSISAVLTGKTPVGVFGGSTHSLAICTDGTLAAWGDNSYGQLGNNSGTDSWAPTAVSTSSLAAGERFAAASSDSNFNLAIVAKPLVPPVATTNDATARTVSSATLNGSVINGANSNIIFEYGLTTSYGSTVTATPSPVTSNTVTPVSANIASLVAGTTYHFRVKATNTLGTSFGSNGTFTTLITNADLSALALNTGTLSPAFASGTTDYTASVPNATTSITVNPILADTTASVRVNGTLVSSGTFSGAISLAVGPNVITTVVTAQDGVTTMTYTVTVTRLSANADLASLVPSEGTLSPAFSSATTAYTASVSPTTANITITPVVIDASATVTVNGTTVVSGSASAPIPLNVGSNSITILVTAQSANTKTYTLVVTRISTNANLSALALGSGTLSPAFTSGTTDYTSSISNSTITIRPTLADTTASVQVNGVLVSSGAFSGAISLALGPNVIITVVTAQDGVTSKTYTITVTRLNATADLSSLVTSAGTLSPVFASGTTAYTNSSVPFSTNYITLTPTVADSTAGVKVNGTTVISGAASIPLPLNVGSNTLTVLVTAQNGATKTYTVAVTRLTTFTTNYSATTDVSMTANGLTATGNTAYFALIFAPPAGTNLTVVNNTGLAPISGTFTNLAQGQIVALSFGGVVYNFVANYYGGNGNDLVLQWANTRPLAWGSNGSGQQGNNGVLDSAVPVPVVRSGVLAGKTILSLSSGGNHSLALCSDGTIAAWGNNSYGQLGNGATSDSLVPVSVSTTGVLLSKTVIAIAAGQYHNVALCSDGTLAAWGYNFYGQLGNGLTTQSSVPVAVSKTGVLAGKTIISIAAGTYHSFALCSDGTLAAWGYNGNGELGNGGTGYSTLPVLVDNSGVLAGKTIRSVIAGSFHNFALCTDGTLAGWGYNAYGQLGNNSVNTSTVPVLVNVSGVLAGKTIISATAGYYHTLALCSDGTLAAWGFNGDGELGNGNNTSSPVPVAVNISGVLAGKSITGISGGAVHNVALCSDGTTATWGYNGDGELGNSSAVSSNIPVLVSSAGLAAGERFVTGNSGCTSLHTLGLAASPPLPVVTTLAASSLTATSAVLNGTINPNGTATTPTFDYGLTTSYGTSVAGTPSSVTGIGSTAVSASISGLAPGTTYHYRLSGTSAGGTTTSADGIFTTAGYNANLSGLALSAGSLSPAFSSAVTSYGASVPNATTSTTVTPTVASPTSTVKVNGATVTSGTASMPIFLAPGLNTIPVIVTAQDGVTTKTYTLAVTRLLPSAEIQVEYAGTNIPDGGGKDFGFSSAGRSSDLTFTIKNIGNADLTGLGITTDGPDATLFTVISPPVAPVSGPLGATTFSIRFLAPSAGTKTATLHIASNDSDENPFDLNLTGLGLSLTADTDGDGLNDAAEFQMEALGFNWQMSQPTLVNVYFTNAEAGGLGSGQGLHVDAPKLSKNPTTGLFKLRIGIQKSTDLLHFTPFPMTAPQTTISGDGKLEFEFASPDNAAFYRLLSE